MEKPTSFDTVASPCMGLCELHPVTRLCRGCLRSSDEIMRWRDVTEDEKRDILRRVEARRQENR